MVVIMWVPGFERSNRRHDRSSVLGSHGARRARRSVFFRIPSRRGRQPPAGPRADPVMPSPSFPAARRLQDFRGLLVPPLAGRAQRRVAAGRASPRGVPGDRCRGRSRGAAATRGRFSRLTFAPAASSARATSPARRGPRTSGASGRRGRLHRFLRVRQRRLHEVPVARGGGEVEQVAIGSRDDPVRSSRRTAMSACRRTSTT